MKEEKSEELQQEPQPYEIPVPLASGRKEEEEEEEEATEVLPPAQKQVEEEEDKLSVESDEVKVKPPELVPSSREEPKYPEYEDADVLAEGTIEDGEIKITVSNPEKIGDGMGAYLAYTVTVKTTLPSFKSSESTVRRRFSDFLGLYAKLVEKHAVSGIMVPVPPEKSAIGMTKLKFSKTDQTETQFVERREKALERFMNRVAMQPVLRKDADFVDFLENPNDLPKSKDTSVMSGAGFKRLMVTVGSAVKSIATKKTDTDQWFEKKAEDFDLLDTQLKTLLEALEDTVAYRKDLVGANAAASKGLAVLSNVEENKSVSHALARLSEVEEKVGQLHQQQYREDLFLITETIKDYVGLMNSVRQMFQMRDRAYQTWQTAQSTLTKKKEAEMKFKVAGKSDKLAQCQAEMQDWEKKLEESQKNFEEVTKTVRREIKLFESRRAAEMKEKMIGYFEALLQQQEEMVRTWEGFLPDAKAISA